MNSISSFCGKPIQVGTNEKKAVYVDPENVAGLTPYDEGTAVILKGVHIAGGGEAYETRMSKVLVDESTDEVASKLNIIA